MRLTTFSIAVTLLIAAGLAIFWPGRNAAPGLAILIAQNAKSDDKQPAPTDQPPDEPTLEERLNKRIDVDFVDLPLKDAIAYLQEHTGIQFVIRQKKLEEASVSPDTPVNKTLRKVRVSTLLELLLDDLDLTFVDRDDLMLVTTPEDAESTLQIRVYDCRDLLAMAAPRPKPPSTALPPAPGGPITPTIPPPPTRSAPPPLPGGAIITPLPSGAPTTAPRASLQQGGLGDPAAIQPATGSNLAPSPTGGTGRAAALGGRIAPQPLTEEERRTNDLIELVTSIVDPDSWDDVGGPGGIDAYNGLVVVAQTAKVHKKVERLFDMLREAAGLEVPKTGKVVR
jgi:general secretion pathway protein D